MLCCNGAVVCLLLIVLFVYLFCRYPIRIEAMQLKLEFEEKIGDIKPSIATLQTAMDEVLRCGALIELFHVALITGNIINGVSTLGTCRCWDVLGCAGVCWDVLGCAGVCWGVLG